MSGLLFDLALFVPSAIVGLTLSRLACTVVDAVLSAVRGVLATADLLAAAREMDLQTLRRDVELDLAQSVGVVR